MASAKEWVVLGRPHTASLTIPATLLGAAAAGATEPALYALLGVWALLFHYFGFVHNNLADLPHDRADPSKAHFPLVSGTIAERTAKRFWLAGTLLVLALGLVITAHTRTGQAALATASLVAAVGFGAAYNELSKRSRAGPLLIAVSFAALPGFAFFAALGPGACAPGGCGAGLRLAVVSSYVILYSFLLMLHDIGYAGYLKDLAPDPVNWLRALGARADARGEGVYAYQFPRGVQAWAWASRLLCPALAFAYVLRYDPAPLTVGLTALFTVLLLVVFARLSKPGEFPRQRKLALMGASEAIAYFIEVASLAGLLAALFGPWSVAAFLLLPLVWFVAMNRLLWGTNVGPRV
jgi:4-hydroxybenzoate polyprenyltransferase